MRGIQCHAERMKSDTKGGETMSITKRELQEENETLRQKLEDVYDVVGDALGFDDDDEESPHEDDDGDSNDNEEE